MSGDFGLRAALPAAVATLAQDPHLHIRLVGQRDSIEQELRSFPLAADTAARWRIEHAPDVVAMSDRPSLALRHKTQSSMYRALELLSAAEVDAVVSAGNTGALMAMGCVQLRTLEGIDRPAICSPLPTRTGQCYLLDLGANVDCRAEHLHQFAQMGAALASAQEGKVQPRVALLNIGQEDGKGNEQVKLAAAAIEADPGLNYIGFIEGDTLFAGGADVVVCDGFVGNVALKVCEGSAGFIAEKLRAALTQSWRARLLAVLARRWLQPLYQELDPQAYNGASLLGLRGVVVKSHGNSSVQSWQYALARAASAVRNDVVGCLQRQLSPGV